MTRALSFTNLIAVGLLLSTPVACSSEGSGPGTADEFVGSWTYDGMLAATCAGLGDLDPIDLTGDTVEITKTDDSHIRIVLGGTCTVNFSVKGDVATANSGQSCPFDVPNLGTQTVAITSWTLTVGSSGNLTSSVSGSAAPCTASGTGTLTPVQ